MDYVPLFDSECWKCGTSPTVALCLPKGPQDTELCGRHFFGESQMVDHDQWNHAQTGETE